MKIYRFSKRAKMSYSIFAIVIVWSSFLIILDPKASIMLKIMVPIGLLMGIAGPWAIFRAEVATDEEKIMWLNVVNILPMFSGKPIDKSTPILYWSEIGEVTATYFLFAEAADLIIKPKQGIDKQPIGFLVGTGAFPLNLLRDILAHLPPDAKVSLYPYLKRKLEGKQTWFYVK